MFTATDRVCTVTLNPAIDQTAGLSGFRPGRVNRIAWDRADPGGKGVNVASFLADFGVGVSVSGLMGQENARCFTDLFAAKHIIDRFVGLPGRVRTNIKLVDEAAHGEGAVTDLNFPGPAASSDSLEHLTIALDALAADHAIFVLSGSLPAGVDDDIYARLTARLKAHGRTVVLDASGAPLRQGVAAEPALIKPNIHELRDLVGPVGDEPADVAAAARRLIGQGIGCVVVSLGAAGAVLVEADEAVHAAALPVEPTSTVGAGDAMVAGLVLGWLRGLSLGGRARLATAFSAAALTTLGPRLPPPAQVEARMSEVRLSPVPA